MIEHHVVGLELSKKLKEIGLKQESQFYWFEWQYTVKLRDKNYQNEISGEFPTSAFIASELLQIIPHSRMVAKLYPFESYRLRLEKAVHVEDVSDFEKIKYKFVYSLNYYCDSTEISGQDAWLARKLFAHNILDETLSDALAKLIIKLHEENLWELK